MFAENAAANLYLTLTTSIVIDRLNERHKNYMREIEDSSY